MKIEFTKIHGTGNDMIMIENMDGTMNLSKEQITYLCDRHFGIGADGLILLEHRGGDADCYMNYYNHDGTPVEMCGNGLRCTVDYFRNRIGNRDPVLRVATRSGIKQVHVGDTENTYTVNMGKPSFASSDFPTKTTNLFGFNFHFVSMGNPHAVAFVPKVDNIPLESVGPNIETHEYFPSGINVEFVEVQDKDSIKVRVWERGCGPTLACGTGACASFAVSRKIHNIASDAKVLLPGGFLDISENAKGELIMTGTVQTVFSGTIEI